MAQLNDLLVLGNTSLIGDVSTNGKITAPEFIGSLTGTATNVPWSGVTSKPATSVSWSNRTLTVNAAGSSATGAIPTTLTGFSSITSTSFWGLLKRQYNANTSNAITGMEWYKKDGTLYQYILGRNATSGTDDGTTSHILINPAYNTSKHTYDTDEGLIIGKNTFVYYNKSIFHTGNYKDLIVTNGLNAPITITNTTATPAAKTDLPILKIRYQNTGGTYYTVDAISAIGTGETGTTINNGCLRMGATSGSLALTAGECGKNMITKHSLTNTENIYLLTDAGVEFYVGCSNDAATSTKALTITSSSGVSPGANNSITLGTSSLKWSNVYATTFNGNLIADHVGNGSNYIAFPKGGKYSTTNSTATGFLNITLPFGKNNTMLRFKISIYNYVTNSSVDYYVGGYTYSDGNWHQTFAYSIGNPVSAIGNLPVIFGHTADGKGCIQIGSSTTTWSYPQVTVSEVIIGYSGGTYSTWANGTWAISFTTTALAAPISTLTNPRIGGAIIYKVSG